MAIGAPEPFEPDFAPGTLDVMRARLLSARWPAVIGEDSWDYGVPQAWLRNMVDYWANEWDWHKVQADMSRFEHFRVEIDGLPIHYMRAKGSGPNPVPIICTHGWPWTFWDMRLLADALAKSADPNAQSFDVIVPSLPGFGFSTPMLETGVDVAAIADRWVKLMTDVLGYDTFLAHGGDWGAFVTAMLGHAHADRMLGVHMSLPVVPGMSRADYGPEDYGADGAWMIDRALQAAPLISSHIAVHRRDPQTLAYAMADSPVGMAAWLWERRRNWSDCGGDVESVFDREHLCTTATLYWATGAFESSLRLYYEHFNHGWRLAHDRSPVIEAPTAYAVSPKELVFLPKVAAEQQTNLKSWTELDAGGHFAAAEQPLAIAADIRAFTAIL